MDSFKFVIEPSEAEKMSQKHGLNTTLQLLPFLTRSALKLSRPPISGFPVAAVGLSTDGRIFIGVNIEFPGLPLHHSIHAEQFLISNLSRYPNSTLKHIVISAYPCGHCRQFLQEIRGASDIQILILPTQDHTNGNIWFKPVENGFKPLSYYLPHRFGPDDLLHEDIPLLLENRENGLILDAELIDLGHKKAVLGALDAVNRSHAPYSKCPSGISLVDKTGNVFKGSYMESAAYNPSLGPVQAAVVDFVAGSLGRAEVGFGDVVEVVLVEKEDCVVRQEETVRLFVKAVFSECEFHVYYCKDKDSLI